MKLREINDWWVKATKKEQLRMTNAPKPHKGDKTSVPTDFSHWAPELNPIKRSHAR